MAMRRIFAPSQAVLALVRVEYRRAAQQLPQVRRHGVQLPVPARAVVAADFIAQEDSLHAAVCHRGQHHVVGPRLQPPLPAIDQPPEAGVASVRVARWPPENAHLRHASERGDAVAPRGVDVLKAGGAVAAAAEVGAAARYRQRDPAALLAQPRLPDVACQPLQAAGRRQHASRRR